MAVKLRDFDHDDSHGRSREKTAASPPHEPSPPFDFPASLRQSWDRGWIPGLILMLATFVAYLPSLRGQFVWDDDSWTTMLQPHFHGVSGLFSIWCEPTILQQYYPLTATTFWLDYNLWGFWTLPYHVENVLLHGLAAVLFWRLLKRLQVPGAWLAAALFALHPVMVESAAWITERKNVLSMVLFLSGMLAYGRFTGFWQPEPSVAQSKRRGFWLAALALSLGALLAKTTTIAFAPTLLLIAWWKHGRLRWREDILPTLPFFAVAIGLGLVTAWIEKTHVGAHGPQWEINFLERCLIAGHALWFYVGKLLWPAGICFVYPRWQLDTSNLGQWLFPATAMLAILSLWLGRNRIGRGPLVAALFFLGTLLPVLGFLNAYFMRYSFVCDHWVYLSSLGFFALFAAFLSHVAERFRTPGLVQACAVAVLPILAFMTWQQSAMYSDVETLYRTTLRLNPNANLARNNLAKLLLQRRRIDEAIALYQQAAAIDPNEPFYPNNLGAALVQKGDYDGAIAELNTALRLKPDYANAHFNLADALNRKGLTAEAIPEFQKTIELEPEYAAAYDNLGTIALNAGKTDEAIAWFEKAVKAQPYHTSALNNLGDLLLREGRVKEAIAKYQQALEFMPNEPVLCNNLASVYLQLGQLELAMPLLQKAVALNPDYVSALYNLAGVLTRQGRIDEAIAHYQRVVELQPDFAEAHGSLGILYFRTAQPAAAITELQKALELDPQSMDAHNNLAWLLATCPDPSTRNGPRAVELASEAVRLSQGTNSAAFSTLAAAYAEAGKFPDAVSAAQRAIALASEQPNSPVLQALRQQLALYQAGSPLRPRSPTNAIAPPRLP
jgi:tetratricopeptide (TPR) repeat protein